MTLGSGTGYDVGTTRSTHTLTITDNDRATATPELTITGGSAVTEGGDASFVISSNPAPSSSITVAYTVSQSGAFVASGQLGSKTRSVSAASTTFTISTEDDNVDEANGSVTVTLDNGNGYTVGNSNSATVTVNDDDDSGGGGGKTRAAGATRPRLRWPCTRTPSTKAEEPPSTPNWRIPYPAW